ncbi:MAG TPA: TolC family protein [Dissulfurispiraceae bacterium]
MFPAMKNSWNAALAGFIVVFLFIIISGTGGVLAAEKQLSLAGAVRLAFDNNYELKAYRNALGAGKEDIGIARGNLLPRITFEERFMRTDNPTYAFMAKLNQERFAASDFAIDSLNRPAPVNDFQTTFSFEQPVFSRKAALGLKMAKTEHAAQNEDYTRKREEIALRVAQRYLSLLTASEYMKVAESAMEDSKEHLRIAELRYDSGLGLYSDTLRASTALNEAEQKLVSARKNLSVAKRALGLLLGLDEPVDAAEANVDIPVLDINYYTNASRSRRDIKSLETRTENVRNGIKLSEAGYLPYVGIGGSYQLNDHSAPFGAEGDSWQVTAFLRWELFDGTKREHERAKAKYRAAEAQEQLNGLKSAVSFKVYEAYLSVDEAKKTTELSRAAMKSAEEGRRLVRVRYENSLSPIIDLLDAQISLDNARASLVARENEYRTAAVKLSYESGTILKDLKLEK